LKFTRGDTVVDFGKLWYLQKRHAARYASSPLSSNPYHDLNKLALEPIIRLLDQRGVDHPGSFEFYRTIPSTAREDYVRNILWADAKNYSKPAEFIKRNTHFWITPPIEFLVEKMPALKLHNVPNLAAQPNPVALTPFFSSFAEIPDDNWNTAEIKSWTYSIIEQAASRSFTELAGKNQRWNHEERDAARQQWGKAWNKLVHQYLRWALMGAMPGPEGAETMRILGREETLRRLDKARELILLKAEEEKEIRKDDDTGTDTAVMSALMMDSHRPSLGAMSSGMDDGRDAETRELRNTDFWDVEEEATTTKAAKGDHEDNDGNDDNNGGDGGGVS
jgi:glutamyl-tRNA synthetase